MHPVSFACLPGKGLRKKKKVKEVSMQCYFLKLSVLSGRVRPLGAGRLCKASCSMVTVCRGEVTWAEAGRAAEGRVTGGLSGSSFAVGSVSPAGGSLGLELTSSHDSGPWRAAAQGALPHPRPELWGTAKEEHGVGGSRRQAWKASLTPGTPLCPAASASRPCAPSVLP